MIVQPWYLATLAVAEQLYDSLIVWKDQDFIQVTAVSQPFFDLFSPGIQPGNISSSSAAFDSLTTSIKNYADSFVAVVAKYTSSNGGLSEQYSRSDGSPVSALDLTWSYTALLTANGARNGVKPASWGASGLTAPSTCSGGGSGGGGGGGGGSTVPVTFNVDATTVFGGTSLNCGISVLVGVFFKKINNLLHGARWQSVPAGCRM